MNRDQVQHEPVLCEPIRQLVTVRPGGTVVDATIGHGGHARLLADAVGASGRLIGFDVDDRNLMRSRHRLEEAFESSNRPHIDLVRANFRYLGEELDKLGIGKVDVILADLGVSTDQLLDDGAGLTFTADGPLDMRLDDRLTTTAEDLVNALAESDLADLIYHNSQERMSRRIAKRICHARRQGRIKRTGELVRIICSAMGVSPSSHRGKIHPATRTFLALRMAVNQEIDALEALLAAAPERLLPGGRLAVISFHSGEDRIVKKDFLAHHREGVYLIHTKKPIRPSIEETRSNPRSRSAKLRVAERAPDTPVAA